MAYIEFNLVLFATLWVKKHATLGITLADVNQFSKLFYGWTQQKFTARFLLYFHCTVTCEAKMLKFYRAQELSASQWSKLRCWKNTRTVIWTLFGSLTRIHGDYAQKSPEWLCLCANCVNKETSCTGVSPTDTIDFQQVTEHGRVQVGDKYSPAVAERSRDASYLPVVSFSSRPTIRRAQSSVSRTSALDLPLRKLNSVLFSFLLFCSAHSLMRGVLCRKQTCIVTVIN